jgi:hypothetical protein
MFINARGVQLSGRTVHGASDAGISDSPVVELGPDALDCVLVGNFIGIFIGDPAKASYGIKVAPGAQRNVLAPNSFQGCLDGDILDESGNFTNSTGSLSNHGLRKPDVNSLVAAATATGADQATALLITNEVNHIGTVAASTGVRLDGNSPPGQDAVVVINGGANALSVYPESGSQIDVLGTNNALTLATGKKALLFRTSSTQWFSVVGA